LQGVTLTDFQETPVPHDLTETHVTVKEAAEMFVVSPRTVHTLIKDGTLPSVLYFGKRLIARQDVIDLRTRLLRGVAA
jgi:excisionase family DNA binding protein